MKVKVLIEKLMQLDPNSEILIKIPDSNYYSELNVDTTKPKISKFNDQFELFTPCSKKSEDSIEHFYIKIN